METRWSMNILLVYLIFVSISEKNTVSQPMPKDQQTDVEFPPTIKKSNTAAVPTGHLRPLGYQRKPEGKVKEYEEAPHPKKFWEDHVSKKRPLVLRQALTESPAALNWDDDYLRKNYGDVDVLIEKKRENRDTQPQRMQFSEFIDNYKVEDWYVVTVLPDEMRQDVEVPKCLLCGTFRKYLHECNLWMSSGGTASVLHYDADHNIHCLFDGRKDFIMIEQRFQRYLSMVDKNKWSGSGFSTLDMDMINMFENPGVGKVPWTWATLRRGDCIYLPAGYLHQVRSYGRSLAATFLFTVDGQFNDTGCADESFEQTSLADVDVIWTYKKGDKTIDMGYMNVEQLRRNFLELIEDDLLIKDKFEAFYYTMQDKDTEELPPIDEAWTLIEYTQKGFLTQRDVINMDRELLKDFARFIDPPHGPAGGHFHDEL
ncbi:bifunctional peptidase and (3S)-lysyl hydroxylase Jmjd7-like isoform X1 [Ptychodera flava]|uniref:bifunctional peptidase and (3S)-lysyl hydroxylase Jmjd7-like isoform X1 n=1 Tax=Ptychodera flava TaxID=63121 RepID=UPI00396A637B